MYSQVAQAYQRTNQATASPRELEALLLIKAAAKLQSVRDEWDETEEKARSAALDEALTYNRRLWTILVTSATKEENPLPVDLKQNIGNLGIFILNHTMRLLIRPEAARLDVLINVNRQIAAGLRGSATSPAA